MITTNQPDTTNQQKFHTMKISEAITQLQTEAFFVISETSADKLDRYTRELLGACNGMYTYMCNYEDILDRVNKEKSLVVGLGGGTAIDFAKYISKHTGMRCIAIPSMLSTNVFATNKVAVFTTNDKHTENGVLPSDVVIDYEYLSKSKTECLYGLVDCFSIYNALRDWRLAHMFDGLKINEEIYERAQRLLEKAIDVAKDIMKHSGNPDSELVEVIKLAGYITNDYGSGRPESGSEHIFASALELDYRKKTGNVIPHALAVAIGMMVMEYLYTFQKLEDEPDHLKGIVGFDDIRKLFGDLVIDHINDLGLKYSDIFNIVMNLRPRADKFTLVNKMFLYSRTYDELKNWLESCGIVFKSTDSEDL